MTKTKTKPKPQLSVAEKKEIVQIYSQGKTDIPTIAEKYSVHMSTIYRVLIASKEDKVSLSSQVSLMLRIKRGANLTNREIGIIMGDKNKRHRYSESTVRYHFMKALHKKTQSDDERLKELDRRNNSCQE